LDIFGGILKPIPKILAFREYVHVGFNAPSYTQKHRVRGQNKIL
jgi:hypothetical protein